MDSKSNRVGRWPDFLIIGVQKGGTSSLFSWLGWHPSVRLPVDKEIHYFDYNYSRGAEWYRDQFPAADLPVLSGEASPYYIFHPLAADRIARDCPEVKLIVLLRDPVARAYSHYMMERKRGNEPLGSFIKALEAEESRLKGEAGRIISGETVFNFNHQVYSYASRGLYHCQLERWFHLFSRDRFLLLKSERLFSDPRAELLRVYRFLGLDPVVPEALTPENTNEYLPMEPEAARWLKDYYREDADRLKALAGAGFDWDQSEG